MSRWDEKKKRINKPVLECSLLSLHPLAELSEDWLHSSSSPVPHYCLCFDMGWASPLHSPSDGCCSWTLLFPLRGQCPVATGCQSSQCPTKAYSNHWKMVLCRREITVTTTCTALIKSSVTHASLNKAIFWCLLIGFYEKVLHLL